MLLFGFIPYFEVPSIPLGPLELHAFGALAALGILVAARLMAYAARIKEPGKDGPMIDMAPVAVAGGLVGGHWLHILGYHREILHDQGFISLFKVWDGLSSMGGVLGGLLAIVVYFRYRGWKLGPYLNALALGVAPGWAIARLGCFVAHDHPGSLTNFPLAVAFPGGARHDLGLDDFFVLAIISGILWLLARRPQRQGALMGVLAILYSIPRFLLDFLRIQTDWGGAPADGRMLSLTPAQWLAPVILVTGVVLLVRSRRFPAAAFPKQPSAKAASLPAP